MKRNHLSCPPRSQDIQNPYLSDIRRASPTLSSGASPVPAPTAPRLKSIIAKSYSDAEVAKLLEGHILIHPALWRYLPVGCEIKYIKKGTGRKGERLRTGGFIKSHHISEDGTKYVVIENKQNGARRHGYVSYSVAYNDIENIWKRYQDANFVEFHLICASLGEKGRQIEDLAARVARLEAS